MQTPSVKRPVLNLHILSFLIVIIVSCQSKPDVFLLNEDFSGQVSGPLLTDPGAYTEFHYLAGARPRSNWEVSTYRYNLPASWEIRTTEGRKVMTHVRLNHNAHWHPMVITGSPFWSDYTVEAEFKPGSLRTRSGILFRYENDRSYYFLGVDKELISLIKVNQGIGFRQPNEIILSKTSYQIYPGETIKVKVTARDSSITVFMPGDEIRTVYDSTFRKGKIGLLADGFAEFYSVKVTTSRQVQEKILRQERDLTHLQDSLAAMNPAMTVYKKLFLGEFGSGRNVRFGDLNGDGETDVLFGQVVHHGPRDRNSELSCLTAMTLDGQILWQTGKPDPWKAMVTNDVAFQIHDINQDGNNEVIYCMNQEIIIAESATGKIIKKTPTPLTPNGKPLESGHNRFPRILGDCIYFLDLQGKGYASDFILKDRYQYLWAFDSNLSLLWENECRTGHYPYAFDTDGDGKDELLAGYTLFDNDGKKLWSLDEQLSDHADGVAIVNMDENEDPHILCAAGDEGMFFADLNGNISKHLHIGHAQNPAVANFRNDLPGLEAVSVNFWGSQGTINLYDKTGNIFHTFEPNQYGSVCLPLNWSGKTEELFLLNANPEQGGAWDGHGRKALRFPDDGHPDMCCATLDITGDCRDEIIVWNPDELWVYTQEDNPLYEEKLYNPKRNPLYNYSNYQVTVSQMAGK
ncbi:MAG: hypothetical protein AAGU19_19625 [Prolixibacteraceae bacterium]